MRTGSGLPTWLNVSRRELGRGAGVKLRVLRDAEALATDMARRMADDLKANNRAGRPTVWIVPVGPVGQYPHLVDLIHRERIATGSAYLINMDEYCDDNDHRIPRTHPLSFAGFMERGFYRQLDPAYRFKKEQRIFPDPGDPAGLERRIAELGGVGVTWGGLGINGHIAFNEPAEHGITMSVEEYAALPTRTLALARETRTINSVTTGGAIAAVPLRCVTVGMKEILASRRIEICCNRPWQGGVLREVLHGPITPARPMSLVRRHPHVTFSVTEEVARKPEVGLR